MSKLSRLKDSLGRAKLDQKGHPLMAYKRPFDDVMREFTVQYPGEIDQLTPEQLAERTGYSLAVARDYLDYHLRAKEDAQIRAQESGAVTYVTSSGKANVVYYPHLGDVKITSTYTRKQLRHNSWGDREPSFLLAPQDAIDIGIYLLGLQPHIRDVLARKDKIQGVQEVEYRTQDMIDEE